MSRLGQKVNALARVLLGLFILWQLVYLPLVNAFNLEATLASSRWYESWLARGTRSLGEATGQEQPWQLFAPNLVEVIPFTVVELFWDEPGTPGVALLSDNEPTDRRHFFRVGQFRLRRAETVLEVAPLLVQVVGRRPDRDR